MTDMKALMAVLDATRWLITDLHYFAQNRVAIIASGEFTDSSHHQNEHLSETGRAKPTKTLYFVGFYYSV